MKTFTYINIIFTVVLLTCISVGAAAQPADEIFRTTAIYTYNANKTNKSKTEFKYDKQGELTLRTDSVWRAATMSWAPDKYATYSWKGNSLLIYTKVWDGNVWRDYSQKTEVYDDELQLLSTETLMLFGQEWVVVENTSYTYDEQANKQKQINELGKITDDEYVLTTYNSDGNPTVVDTYELTNGVKTLSGSVRYDIATDGDTYIGRGYTDSVLVSEYRREVVASDANKMSTISWYTYDSEKEEYTLTDREISRVDDSDHQILNEVYGFGLSAPVWGDPVEYKYDLEYNENDKVVSRITYVKQSDDTFLPTLKQEYGYDQFGMINMSANYEYADTAWVGVGYQEYTNYDNKLRVISTALRVWDAENACWKNKSHSGYYRYEYDLETNTRTTYTWSTNYYWDKLSKQRVPTYDEKGREIKALTRSYNQTESLWYESGLEEKVYDSADRLVAEREYSRTQSDTAWIGSTHTSYEYDEVGRKTNMTTYGWRLRSGDWHPTAIYTYVYDNGEPHSDLTFKSNILTSNTYYDYTYPEIGKEWRYTYLWEDTSYEMTEKVLTIHEENTRGQETLSQTMTYDVDDTWTAGNATEYEYDNLGRQTLRTTKYLDKKAKVFYEYEIVKYSYDYSGNQTAHTLCETSISGTTKTVVKHDENDNLILSETYTWLTADNSWHLTTGNSWEIETDSAGRTLSYISKSYDSTKSAYIFGKKEVHTYDEHGGSTLDEYFTYEKTTGEWVQTAGRIAENEYANDDKIASALTQTFNPETNAYEAPVRIDYEYAENGNMIAETHHAESAISGQWEAIRKYDYAFATTEKGDAYIENGTVVADSIVTADGTSVLRTSNETFNSTCTFVQTESTKFYPNNEVKAKLVSVNIGTYDKVTIGSEEFAADYFINSTNLAPKASVGTSANEMGNWLVFDNSKYQMNMDVAQNGYIYMILRIMSNYVPYVVEFPLGDENRLTSSKTSVVGFEYVGVYPDLTDGILGNTDGILSCSLSNLNANGRYIGKAVLPNLEQLALGAEYSTATDSWDLTAYTTAISESAEHSQKGKLNKLGLGVLKFPVRAGYTYCMFVPQSSTAGYVGYAFSTDNVDVTITNTSDASLDLYVAEEGKAFLAYASKETSDSKTETYYDEAGRAIMTISDTYDNGWTESSRSGYRLSYTRDANGYITGAIKQVYDQSTQTYKNTARCAYVNDRNGCHTLITTYNIDESGTESFVSTEGSKYSYTYDDYGRVVEAIYSVYSDGSFDEQTRDVYGYATNEPTEEPTFVAKYNKANNAWELSSGSGYLCENIYDTTGNLIYSERKNWDKIQGALVKALRTTQSFDDNGRTLSSKVEKYYEALERYEPTEEIKYYHTDSGSYSVKTYSATYSVSSATSAQKSETIRNEHNDIVENVAYSLMSDGVTWRCNYGYRYDYTYDEIGKKVRLDSYDYNYAAAQWMLTNTTMYDNGINRTLFLGVISNYTIYNTEEYDLFGNLTAQIRHSYESGEWKPTKGSKTEYVLDDNYVETARHEYTYSTATGTWVKTATYEKSNLVYEGILDDVYLTAYTYDSLGNTIMIENSEWVDDEWSLTGRQKMELTYDGNDTIVSQKEYTWFTGTQDWLYTGYYKISYTSGGAMIKTPIEEVKLSSDNSQKEELTYDENGVQTTSVTYDYDLSSDAWTAVRRQEFTCDTIGNPINITEYAYDSRKETWSKVGEYQAEHSYDDKDGIIYTILRTLESHTAIVGTEKEITEYDENGNKTCSVVYTWDNTANDNEGDWVEAYKTIWQYDGQNDLSRIEYYYHNGTKYVLSAYAETVIANILEEDDENPTQLCATSANEPSQDNMIYDLGGKCVGKDIRLLRQGLYVRGGKLIIVK